MLPFLPLKPSSPEDEKSPLVDAVILIPDAPYHVPGLFMKRSDVRLSQEGERIDDPGLFTSSPIKPGQLIGFFTGHFVSNDIYNAYPKPVIKLLSKYAAGTAAGVVVSPLNPDLPSTRIDFLKHPLALANEPSRQATANAFAETHKLETGDSQFVAVCMFACSPIDANSEITWIYGDEYKRDYFVGVDCVKPPRLQDPLEMLLASRLHPDFKFVAHQLPDSSEDESEEQFVPQKHSSCPSRLKVGRKCMPLPSLSNLETRVLTRRSEREEALSTPPPPPLGAFERDSSGCVVYVDLNSPALQPGFDLLRARLAAVTPSDDAIVRSGTRINENRFLWTVNDGQAIDLFSTFLQSAFRAPYVDGALRALLAPLGGRIKLLGAHFICGRLSEATPLILPQKLHRDHGGGAGEVIAVGMHLDGEQMGTLIAPMATEVDDLNPEIAAANTPVFAFDTHVVHGGPPGNKIAHRGPARLVKNRVFFMLCSERLPTDRVALHREDNGFRNVPEVVIDLSGSSPDLQPRRYARMHGEERTAPRPPQSAEQEFFPVLIPPSRYRDRGGGENSMDTDCLATDLNILQVSSTGAHYGVNSDASTPIGLIALSRLARSKDEITARRMATSPIGLATLTALRSLVARVALAVGIDGFTETNATSLLQLHGSATKYKTQYGDFGSLQTRLPWPKFKEFVSSFLEALTTSRQTGTIGYAVGHRLISSAPDTPVDGDAQAAIASLVEFVEAAMKRRLGQVSSSTLPPAPPPAVAPAVTVFNIVLSQSLNGNLLRLVEHRFQRPLSAPETIAITAAFNEGLTSFQMGGTLSEFQTGGAAARAELLGRNMGLAMTNKSATWLWANVVEVTDRPASSISDLASAISEGCRSVAAMLFMDAATNFAP